MNPAIPLDEACGRPGRTQNHTLQALYNDQTPGSLPDKDTLLLILHLKRIHEEQQKLPERHMGEELIA